jgi:hypothetical protein
MAYSSGSPSDGQWTSGGNLSLRVGACLLVLFVSGACASGRQSSGGSKEVAPGQTRGVGATDRTLASFPGGWTRLPLPPEWREGAALVWTGSELLAWGGCDLVEEDECIPTGDGLAFNLGTRKWSGIPEAPVAADHPHVVWTGEEAVFFGLQNEDRIDGQSYEPEAQGWRTIASAPVAPRDGAVHVWTGAEVIVWGGGKGGEPLNTEGAAYDPATDAWRRITESPLGLNLASGIWTGREMLVFGSLLDGRNYASTPTSVGAAYDPSRNAWRELPSSALSPQATSAVWAGGQMVAWDYEVHSQAYDPKKNTWSIPQKMPFDFSECYPDSVAFQGLVFAFFCGRAALYEPATNRWQEIRDGPLEEEVWSDAYRRRIKVWRFAYLVPAGDVLLLLMEGLTLDGKGIACYGCDSSPVSFWAYRPPR